MITKSLQLRGLEKSREKKFYLVQLVASLSILLVVYLISKQSSPRVNWPYNLRYSHVGSYLTSTDFAKSIKTSLHFQTQDADDLSTDVQEEEPLELSIGEHEDIETAIIIEEEEEEEEEDQQPTTITPTPTASEYIEDQYHMVVSTDNSIYSQWMIQVCYQQYLKMKQKYPNGPLGGFTRLLHSNVTDSLMDRIPTIRVDELPYSELSLDEDWVTTFYPPLNRPYAFYQFTRDHLHTIPERYIFMSEPDHIIMEPPPLPSQRDRPISSGFWYMSPQSLPDIVAHFNPKNLSIEHFYPTGNAPGIMDRDQIAAISENWFEFTKTLLHTREFRNTIGWVLEMYSFVFAAATTLDEPIHFDLMDNFQTHPPREDLYINGKLANIFHFTYAGYMNATNDCSWSDKEEEEKIPGEWQWDKRFYRVVSPNTNFLPPPSRNPSCDSMRLLVGYFNEASSQSPNWLQMMEPNGVYPWIKQDRERMEKGEPVPEAVRLPMNELLDLYVDHYLGFSNEFSESLVPLREYAQKCSSIFVLGQGSCTVLWPLMQGLHAGTTTAPTTPTHKSIIGSDATFHPNVDEVKKVASGLGIDYTFHQLPSLLFEIEKTTEYEMLFIDTWHVAGQLRRELQKYAANRPGLKYIAIHGTTTYGAVSQSVQVGWDVQAQAVEQGMMVEEVEKGLKPAIEEFVGVNVEWVVEREIEEGNGLTILARKERSQEEEGGGGGGDAKV
jgi:hypothetical protein